MSLFIGLSALQSSQTGLDIISQNIANANTLGYHRQSVHFESLNENLFRGRRIGSGVAVNDIERIRYQVIESFLTEAASDVNRVGQRLSIESQLETLFLPGEGSLQVTLDTLFNDIASLASRPSDGTTRNLVVQSGAQLADQFRQLSRQLGGTREALLSQANREVIQLNAEIAELGELNREIVIASATSGPPNGLLDQRDVLINSIAEKINVSRIDLENGGISLTFGNYSIASTVTDIEFSVAEATDGNISIVFGGGERTLQLNSGRIAGLVDGYNRIIPEYVDKLDELASSLIRNFDQVHATGVGTSGPFSRLVGNRPVNFINVPLAQAGAAFPIEQGDLYFSITAPDGSRRTASISIDPATQSLQDVASLINGIGNLNASVNSQTNQLQIAASPGYRFDFTGSVATAPTLGTYTGTSLPVFSGQYDGEVNEEFNFLVVGSGDVGVSDNLSVQVTDSSGNPIATLNIGNGYEAGQPIKVADGITITLPAGTVADGDDFSVTGVANPDATGILSALGLNSFFSGRDAKTIAIDQRIVNDPRLFSSSLSGDAAAASKILEFGELQQLNVLGDGRLTFSEYINELTSELGVKVQSSTRLSANLETLAAQYQRERDSISGVDVNEEFVRLTQYQRSYEAAVRVIQTAEAVLDELFTILR